MAAPPPPRGGRVGDRGRDLEETAAVWSRAGRFAAVGPGLGAPAGATVRDVRGTVVAPGLVDVHVHLREPGNEDEETIATGARAAVAGGVTAGGARPPTGPRAANHAPARLTLRPTLSARVVPLYPID